VRLVFAHGVNVALSMGLPQWRAQTTPGDYSIESYVKVIGYGKFLGRTRWRLSQVQLNALVPDAVLPEGWSKEEKTV
jgi:hypothetical protein